MGLLDFLTGGGLGAVAGAVGGIAGKVYDLKMKKHELEARKLEQVHELNLRRADMEMAAQEAASKLELGKVDADARMVVADIGALQASLQADKATYGDHTMGRIVDLVRGLTRPLVTFAATAFVVASGLDDPSVRPQAMFIASMAISWWFAARPGKLADYKK